MSPYGTLLASAEAASCPQLAEGDIGALADRSGFDPSRLSRSPIDALREGLLDFRLFDLNGYRPIYQPRRGAHLPVEDGSFSSSGNRCFQNSRRRWYRGRASRSNAGSNWKRPFFTRLISRSMIPSSGGLRSSSAALMASTRALIFSRCGAGS